MIRKDWTNNVGLPTFPNTAHQPNLLMKGEILHKQVATFKKKMHTVLKQNAID